MYTGETGYLQLLQHVLDNGERRSNRTGTDTLSVVGSQIQFVLDDMFPLITTKAVWWKGIAVELDWMLQGLSNVKYMQDLGVKIWDAWADPDTGELGPVYGVQWRSWQPGFDAATRIREWYEVFSNNPSFAIETFQHLHEAWKKAVPAASRKRASVGYEFGALTDKILAGDQVSIDRAVLLALQLTSEIHSPVDQIAGIVDKLRNNRTDRRIILSAWNVGELPKMKLPPCHFAAQFLVDNNNRLTCVVSIRSWDLFLGGPFNIGQYALLTCLLAHVSGLKPYTLIINAGDAHVYVNHVDQVREQIQRSPRAYPRLNLNDVNPDDIDAFRWDQAKIEDYDPHPALRGEIAI